MTAGGRRLGLIFHVGLSVSWLGVAIAFVVLGSVALVSNHEGTVRAIYVTMAPLALWVLLPLAVAALIVGVVHAWRSPVGLLNHWWVVVKLAITAVWVLFLFLYLPTFHLMSTRAEDLTVPVDDIRTLSPVLHAAVASAGLVLALALSILRPHGRTPLGDRTMV
jgi:hypothetical protein